MTKQEEINKLNEFVSNLPDGYLSDIFKDIEPMIADAIRSDFCVIPMREVWEQKKKYYEEMIGFLNEKNRIQESIKKMQNEKEFLENSINSAKQKLAQMAKSMLSVV